MIKISSDALLASYVNSFNIYIRAVYYISMCIRSRICLHNMGVIIAYIVNYSSLSFLGTWPSIWGATCPKKNHRDVPKKTVGFFLVPKSLSQKPLATGHWPDAISTTLPHLEG